MSDWHPLLAAVEVEPGEWRMVAQYDDCYGVIRFLPLDRQYAATTWAERSADGELIGYYRSLKAATMGTHQRFVRSHGAGPHIGYPGTTKSPGHSEE